VSVQQFNGEMIAGRAGIIRAFRKESREWNKRITWCVKSKQRIRNMKQQERSQGEARVEQSEKKKEKKRERERLSIR